MRVLVDAPDDERQVQITPREAKRAFATMMETKKIDVAVIEKARRG